MTTDIHITQEYEKLKVSVDLKLKADITHQTPWLQ